MSEGGIAPAKRCTNPGYGKQILNELVDYAYRTLNFEFSVYQRRAENPVSRKLAESCAFHFEKNGK